MKKIDEFCKHCKYYKYNQHLGILCGLTDDKPSFYSGKCNAFVFDPERYKKVMNEIKKNIANKKISQEGECSKEIMDSLPDGPTVNIGFFEWYFEKEGFNSGGAFTGTMVLIITFVKFIPLMFKVLDGASVASPVLCVLLAPAGIILSLFLIIKPFINFKKGQDWLN